MASNSGRSVMESPYWHMKEATESIPVIDKSYGLGSIAKKTGVEEIVSPYEYNNPQSVEVKGKMH